MDIIFRFYKISNLFMEILVLVWWIFILYILFQEWYKWINSHIECIKKSEKIKLKADRTTYWKSKYEKTYHYDFTHIKKKKVNNKINDLNKEVKEKNMIYNFQHPMSPNREVKKNLNTIIIK